MTTGFDELTKRAGSMRTRRHVLGLFGRTAAAAMVGSAVLSGRAPGAWATEDCVVEYPVADLDDCPNKRQRPGTGNTSSMCRTLAGNDAYGWASYSKGCQNFNICYSTCNSNRSTCDTKFNDDAIDACIGAYPTRPLHQLACITHANFTALGMASSSHFEATQKIYCECCRPPTKIKCNCTGACYETPAECLEDCKVGLGCFTDVCKPVPADQCS